MQPGGQSIVDRLLAAKNTIAGQSLAKVVCKATTEEMIGPKRKHLDFLVQATNEMNVSIPEVADLLIERAQNSSWVVCLKALVTIHHLMYYGNERFQAYMASHNHHLQSAVWVDRNGVPGGGDMSSYIRCYAAYLNEKRDSYKQMGYDFCKIKRGKDDGLLRTMATDKLLKTLPILQKQLDAALLFEVSSSELLNPVIHSCFLLLIKDLIRLYATFNDGMINLLEKYFDMNKKQCREALDIYKRFLERTDKVSQFLKIAETSGVEHNEIPDLSRAPSSLLEALENHLAHIEGKKSAAQTVSSRRQTEEDVRNFSRDLIISDDDPQKILEEEAKALAHFNKKKEASSSNLQQKKNEQPTKSVNANSLNEDLLSLGTPAELVMNNNQNATLTTNNLFDEILQPTSTSMVMPLSVAPTVQAVPMIPTSTVNKGDLNSSLNHLLENLDIKDHSKVSKDHLWKPNDQKNQQKIGSTPTLLNTPGPTWCNVNVPMMNIQNGNIWPQTAPAVYPNNPFAGGQIPAPMNMVGLPYRPPHFNGNPFVASTSYNNTSLNTHQVNDPFGSL